MRGKNLLMVLLLLLFSAFGLSACGNSGGSISGSALESSGEVLEMQGYELDVPRSYECTGGFTDGYRYLDAECIPENEDYIIEADTGLVASAIGSMSEYPESHISLRQTQLDAICTRYREEMELGADYYSCIEEKSNEVIITFGIVKAVESDVSRWFEARLISQEIDSEEAKEYVQTLANFLNSAVKIDWSDYEN